MAKENQIIIDEIKTGEHTFEQLEDATLQLFMAQAKIYAYIYALQEKLEEVVVMVRYFCTQDEKIDEYQNQYSFDELNNYYQETMKEYEKWLIFLDKYRQNRQKKLQALQFPYNNYRKGQRELSIAVYRTLSQEKCLFMEAPTGTEKHYQPFSCTESYGRIHSRTYFLSNSQNDYKTSCFRYDEVI